MKKLLFVLALIFCISPIFAKSYSEYLAEAKKYEAQKKWCYALGSYYDAMGTDEKPEDKQEAYEGYKALSEAIKSSNPGLGKFNVFTAYESWKSLLIDAEDYGSSFNPYEVTVGDLIMGKVNYAEKTATYSAEVCVKFSYRFEKTVQVVIEGYKKAHRDDWNDLPADWPDRSAKYGGEFGVVISVEDDDSSDDPEFSLEPLVWDFKWCPRYCSYVFYNAFYTSLKDNKFIKCEFNIVDEKGKELVKSKKYVLPNNRGSICFDGIGSEIMELINEKKAFLNPVACYLMHGCRKEDWGEGAFYNDMDSLQEMPLFMEKSVFICGKNKEDKIGKNVFSTMDFGCEKTELENSLNYFLEMYCWYSDSENEIQFYDWKWEELVEDGPEYPILSNLLSKREGKEPIYSIDIFIKYELDSTGNVINARYAYKTISGQYKKSETAWKFVPIGCGR